MNKKLLEIPTCFETQRLLVRSYEPGDGVWYFVVGQKNHTHLERYESGNVIFDLKNEEEAEKAVQAMHSDYLAGKYFFMGAFEKKFMQFVAQLYIGVANEELPEFDMGYFADVDHEGQGYVSEAVRGALKFVFKHLKAQRVRIKCDDTNLRSMQVAERCGFKLEARFRENKLNPDGTISGTVVYGLLRREFLDPEKSD